MSLKALSREIKFRAWDADEKEMVYNPQYEADEWFKTLLACEADEGDALMQFTGLHDKNGKEIYEGDIVSISNQVFPIEWQYDRWYPGDYDNGDYYHGYEMSRSSWKETEILGNIYEHPHLLTKENE